MPQSAGGRLRPILLLGKRDDGRNVRVFRIRDFEEALLLLQTSLSDPSTMEGIRSWWAAEGGFVHRQDRSTLADIALAETKGRISFAEPLPWRPRSAPDDHERQRSDRGRPVQPPRKRERPPALPKERERPVQPTKPEESVKTWIEFRLVDDDTKEPVSGVPFKIKLTDGSERVETTDGAGKIRIDDIDPGTCRILEIAADAAPEVTQIRGS